MIIEKIKKEDAKELAHNIAVVWNTTYKGIVDNEFLEILYLNEDYSAKNIINKIDNNDNYYVLKLNNKIIGWIYYDYVSDKYENAGEIYSLYILKEYHKKGYGKLLFNLAVNDMKKNNINKFVVGCLEGNLSNEFYKYMGGKYIGNNLFREKYLENIYLFIV